MTVDKFRSSVYVNEFFTSGNVWFWIYRCLSIRFWRSDFNISPSISLLNLNTRKYRTIIHSLGIHWSDLTTQKHFSCWASVAVWSPPPSERHGRRATMCVWPASGWRRRIVLVRRERVRLVISVIHCPSVVCPCTTSSPPSSFIVITQYNNISPPTVGESTTGSRIVHSVTVSFRF